MTMNRTKVPMKSHIGPVVDHHSIVRDNGHFIEWDTFAPQLYGREDGTGRVEKVIPDACPVLVVYSKKRKADVIVSIEHMSAADTYDLPDSDYDTSAGRIYVAALIGHAEQFNRGLAMNGAGVMRKAGLYENVLYGVDPTTGQLPAYIREAMLKTGFYFATYRDIRGASQ